MRGEMGDLALVGRWGSKCSPRITWQLSTKFSVVEDQEWRADDGLHSSTYLKSGYHSALCCLFVFPTTAGATLLRTLRAHNIIDSQ